jgi:hypothetical protein
MAHGKVSPPAGVGLLAARKEEDDTRDGLSVKEAFADLDYRWDREVPDSEP